ncbi:MAG: hypothetical protein ACXADB_11325 [Candidatus Hermodarchaeia archaeon]|jgi:hypothetical protein
MKRNTYRKFRETVEMVLNGDTNGLTWNQLRKKGNIEQTRPCYNWYEKLENDIGLTRERIGRHVYCKLSNE